MKLSHHPPRTALAVALTCLFALPTCVFSQAPAPASTDSDKKQRDDKRNRKAIDEYHADIEVGWDPRGPEIRGRPETEQEQMDRAGRMSDDRDRAKRRRASLRLVVMITGELDGSPAIGAGIAFGRGDGKLYIATANHVVRRGPAQARKLKVKLKDAPSVAFDAQLLPHFDASADLAVLSVDTQSMQGIDVCSWLFFQLMDAKDVQRGDAVYLVGNPNGFEWELSVKPDMVAQVDETRISFQSAFLGPGHSGGALLDEPGHLVGMIQSDLPPRGAALTLSGMLPILRKWDYIVELYEPNKDFDSALEQAASAGDLNTIRRNVATCPNVNAEGYRGRTTLHTAARFGQVDVIQLLLKAGADLNVRIEGGGDNHHSTPLELASSGGHVEAVKVLLAAGVPVSGLGSYAWPPLHWAAHGGRREIIDLLCTYGADVNVRAGAAGTNALNIAAGANQLDAVQALLARGADVNAKAVDGRTPLHSAADALHLEVVRALLAAGADVNAKTDSGSTPLDSSYSNFRDREATRGEVQDLLRSHGGKFSPALQKLLRGDGRKD